MKDAAGQQVVAELTTLPDVISPLDSANPKDLSLDEPLGEADSPADEEEGQKLADYFSGNKEVMDLFLSLSFLIQRVNTGGLAISELQALNSITKRMADSFGLDTDFLNYIVGSISDNKAIYKMFEKNSSELNVIQKQQPKRLCEIMAQHLPNDYGYILSMSFSGDLLDDLKRVESVMSLVGKTHVRELTAMNSHLFSIKPVNPWSVLLEDYRPGHNVSKNTMVTAFKHPASENSSVYLIQSLVTVRRWLLRRIPKEKDLLKKQPVIERLSKFDAAMERERFLGITPTFLSLSSNRPYRNEKLDSRFVFIRDVEESEDDTSDSNEVHVSDADTEVGNIGFFGKVKKILRRGVGKKGKEDTSVQVKGIEYSLDLVDYAGYLASYENLSWFLINEPIEDTMLRQYRQIFFGCAIGEAIDNTIDVSTGIIGRWKDVATGYYMAVNYAMKDEDEDEDEVD